MLVAADQLQSQIALLVRGAEPLEILDPVLHEDHFGHGLGSAHLTEMQ